MKASPQQRKRIQFGPVTVHHVPAVSDSQDSSLVNSQVISTDLLDAVQRAVPPLSALDHNAYPAVTCSKRRRGDPLLLGEEEEEEREKGNTAPLSSTVVLTPRAQHRNRRRSCTSTQQPRLSLFYDSTAAFAVPGKETPCSGPHSLTLEDDVESSTADSDEETTESEKGCLSSQTRCGIALAAAVSRDFSHCHKEALPPTLSQLISAVDDILDSPTSQDRAAMTPGDASVCVADHPSPLRDVPRGVEEKLDMSSTTVHCSSHVMVKDYVEDDSSAVTAPPPLPAESLPLPTATPHAVKAVRCLPDPPLACVFCALSPEAQRHRDKAPPLLTSEGHAFHLACALWCPEVYVDVITEAVCGVAAAACRARRIKCALCRQPGAAVGCAESTCQLSFHLPCAAKAKAAMAKEHFVLRCPAHGRGICKDDGKRQHRRPVGAKALKK